MRFVKINDRFLNLDMVTEVLVCDAQEARPGSFIPSTPFRVIVRFAAIVDSMMMESWYDEEDGERLLNALEKIGYYAA